MAFGFDKLQQSKDKNKETELETAETKRLDELKIKKSNLRNYAKIHGQKAILASARGIHN